jgi:hypothetical protein
MGHDVAKPRHALEAACERAVDVSGLRESPEGVGVSGGRARLQAHTGRDSQIDHDLHRLPEVQDHRIGRIRGGHELRWFLGEAGPHPVEVALDRSGLLGQYLAVEGAQRGRSASTAS